MPHELVRMEHQEKPRIETDFMYMKSDGSVCETLESGEPPTNEWCTILTAVDKDSSSKLGVVIPIKETKSDENVYAKKSLADFIRRLGHREVQVLRDQEPALIALVESIIAECSKLGIVVDPRDAPRYSHASLGAMGRAQQTTFAVKANGRTCYEDAFGTGYRGPVLPFLEACSTKSDTGAMTRGRRAQKADNLWDRGLWLG